MADVLLFDESYKKLNSAQKQAVDAIDGPVFVIAGPGTGKTQILTLRIANILRLTDTPAEAILALTFTESAVAQMRDRLAKLIGSASARVRIYTFHGFAQTLVERHPDNFSRIIGSQISTDIERAEMISEILINTTLEYLRPFGDPMHYHVAVVNALSTLKREGVSVKDLANRIVQTEKDFAAIPDAIHTSGKYEGKLKGKYEKQKKQIAKTHDLLSVYTAYEEELSKRKRYDFDDLMLEAVRALTEDDAFRREVQESVFYVLADEHQDANAAQNSLLELLVEYHEHPNLFIVGDEKQAIYRFQGASLDAMHHFRSRFGQTKIIPLTDNYRSTQTILDAALSLITASDDARLSVVPLRACAQSSQNKSITIVESDTSDDEDSYIANDILARLGAGIPPEEIVVLLRRKKDVEIITDMLRGYGVPAVGTEQNIFENRFAKALIRFLLVLHEPSDMRFSGILNLPNFHISVSDAWRITHVAHKLKMPIIAMLSSSRELSVAGVKDISIARGLYELINHLAHVSTVERPAVVADMAMRSSGILDMALHATDSEESLGALRALIRMFDELSEREHDALLPRALAQIELAKERCISSRSLFLELASRVKVMTVHRAKGSEFSFVYIPRFTDKIWNGSARASNFYVPDIFTTESGYEDERRLFYVAITRAKERCVISYAGTKEDGSIQVPSSFLEDIDSKCVTHVKSKAIIGIPPRQAHVNIVKDSSPSDDERNTLAEAFGSQGLTPTALNNYLDCPWHYFYVNLLRIPESENKFMIFGTAMHAVLKYYADKRNEGKDIPASELVTALSGFLSHTALTSSEIVALSKKGETALTSWWRERHNVWLEHTESEKPIEVTIKTSSGELVVRGKLDRIDLTEDGVMVIDYKTGKPKTHNAILGKTKGGTGDYFRQLVFYKLLLARAPEALDMRYGVIDFVEPDEKGNIHKEVFDITQDDVDGLVAILERVASEIRALSFWNTTCNNTDCQWCALRF